jgi:hypothetical protein
LALAQAAGARGGSDGGGVDTLVACSQRGGLYVLRSVVRSV